MKTCQIRYALGSTLAMFLACSLYLPAAGAGELNGTEWKVTRGDTLYAIGRAVYAKDASKQAQLRRDIIRLNPAVFENGANRMTVGVVLKLPEYVVHQPTAVPAKKQTPPEPAPVVVAATGLKRAEWVTKSGDTLYAIGRSVYPGNASKQARLRQDIIKLNPSVFANGANKMEVGVVLTLPDYVVLQVASPKVGEPAQVPKPAPVEVTPEPSPQPAAPAAVVEPEPETPREVPSAPSRAKGNVAVSLGYAYGGDKLVYQGGSYDPAGAAGHLRLGYEQMYQSASGYRIALGLQYGSASGGGGSTSLRDVYLQLAYQYRANPFVYGIGVVISEGATLNGSSTINYDAANGAVVYLENVGSSGLAGWGLSYTFLDIEEKGTATSFDASRAELYYSWRF